MFFELALGTLVRVLVHSFNSDNRLFPETDSILVTHFNEFFNSFANRLDYEPNPHFGTLFLDLIVFMLSASAYLNGKRSLILTMMPCYIFLIAGLHFQLSLVAGLFVWIVTLADQEQYIISSFLFGVYLFSHEYSSIFLPAICVFLLGKLLRDKR